MLKRIDKRIFFMVMAAMTVSGFIVICTLGQSLHRQKVASRTNVSAADLEQPVCIVREYKGRIGIFKGGSDAPYRVIDYDIGLLSEFDRRQLDEGIVMETEYELNRFIEDIAT